MSLQNDKIICSETLVNNNLPNQTNGVMVNPENPVNPDSNALIKNDTFITHPLSAALRIGEKMNNE